MQCNSTDRSLPLLNFNAHFLCISYLFTVKNLTFNFSLTNKTSHCGYFTSAKHSHTTYNECCTAADDQTVTS